MTKYAVLFMVAVVVGFFLGGPAWAEVIYNEKVPYETTFFVPCANEGAGEWVDFSGFQRVKFSLTENGNTYSSSLQYQTMGVTGVGQDTGDIYRVTGGYRYSQSSAFTGYPSRYTVLDKLNVIGPGPEINFTVHQTWHITVNANGDYTAEVDNYKVDCK